MKRLIFVLICLCLMFPPVLGYDLLDTYSNEPGAATQIFLIYLNPMSAGTWNNVTRIYATGSFARIDNMNMQLVDYPVTLKTTSCSGVTVSNASFSLNINGETANDVYYPGSTVEIKDFNASAVTTQSGLWICDGTTQIRATVGSAQMLANNTMTAGDNRVQFVSTSTLGAAAFSVYGGTAMSIPTADFFGTPISGMAPLTVNLTDNSTGPATQWNWSATGPGSTFFDDPTTENPTAIFPTAGNYTITHGVANALGSDIETKTDYIFVYDDNTTVETGFLATDGTSGYPINGAQVDLYDIENTSWKNTTTIGGLGIISTLAGHTINAYANATGYQDADLLAQPAKAGSFYQIYMWPDVGFKNVSEGMVTAYFHVNDANTGDHIPGALISGGGENYGVMVNSTMFGLTTNSAGMASIAVQNNTNIYITTSKGGYQTASQAFATGPGSGGTDQVTVSISLSKLTVTPTATMTTLPGQPGVYPTTVDPYSLLSAEKKQESLAGDVLDWAPMLINLFILLTVIGGIKMIAK